MEYCIGQYRRFSEGHLCGVRTYEDDSDFGSHGGGLGSTVVQREEEEESMRMERRRQGAARHGVLYLDAGGEVGLLITIP
jgi:hypothetical protein